MLLLLGDGLVRENPRLVVHRLSRSELTGEPLEGGATDLIRVRRHRKRGRVTAAGTRARHGRLTAPRLGKQPPDHADEHLGGVAERFRSPGPR